ncbi:MAG: XRE family transcriptional regulator [Oxalobacteraceae bacterium]|nr:MAG: XRE family transcriptional regulator [Oxalobacteraceae bacterium]
MQRYMRAAETNFGSELFVMRSRKGATQADIAIRAGLGRGYYSQLENSKKGPPSPRLLERIVAALELQDDEARRLLTVAVADRCMVACQSTGASTAVAPLVKSLVQCASSITHEKAERIAAILKED